MEGSLSFELTNAATGTQRVFFFSSDSCEHAKAAHRAIGNKTTISRIQSSGEEIHTDIWGPACLDLTALLQVPGRKVSYFVAFADKPLAALLDYLRSHSKRTNYKAIAACAKPEAHRAPQEVRRRIHRRGIYSFSENGLGVAESLDRRLFERVCGVLHISQLPKSLGRLGDYFILLSG